LKERFQNYAYQSLISILLLVRVVLHCTLLWVILKSMNKRPRLCQLEDLSVTPNAFNAPLKFLAAIMQTPGDSKSNVRRGEQKDSDEKQ